MDPPFDAALNVRPISGLRADRHHGFQAVKSFDLAADPEEQHSLLATEPERALRLRQRLAAWISFEDQFLAVPAPATVR